MQEQYSKNHNLRKNIHCKNAYEDSESNTYYSCCPTNNANILIIVFHSGRVLKY